MIRSEEKSDIKDKFLDSKADQKKADDAPQTRTLTERERESERKTETEVKLETMHHPHWPSYSPLWRKQLIHKSPKTPLLSTPVTSDWPRMLKSNNLITIKHRILTYFLIPYQHVFTNPAIWTFYSFVSNTIVKILTCLHVFCFCNSVFLYFLCNHTQI